VKNIIEAIVECDVNAKKIVDEAHAERKRIEQSIPAELERARREAYESAEIQLDSAREAAKKQTAAELDKIKVFNEQKLGDFRETYLKGRDGWVNSIYTAVIADED